MNGCNSVWFCPSTTDYQRLLQLCFFCFICFILSDFNHCLIVTFVGNNHVCSTLNSITKMDQVPTFDSEIIWIKVFSNYSISMMCFGANMVLWFLLLYQGFNHIYISSLKTSCAQFTSLIISVSTILNLIVPVSEWFWQYGV